MMSSPVQQQIATTIRNNFVAGEARIQLGVDFRRVAAVVADHALVAFGRRDDDNPPVRSRSENVTEARRDRDATLEVDRVQRFAKEQFVVHAPARTLQDGRDRSRASGLRQNPSYDDATDACCGQDVDGLRGLGTENVGNGPI